MNRTSTDWSEAMGLRQQFGSMAFSTDWNVGIQQNPAQNNKYQQTGTGNASLDYVSDDYGGWSFGATGYLREQSKETDFLVQRFDDSEVGLALSSSLPGEYFRRRFELSPDNFRWDVTATAGLTQSIDANERRSRDDENSFERSDSTTATGVARTVTSDFFYAPDTAWSVTVNAETSLGEGPYDALLTFPDSTRTLEGTNRNTGQKLSVRTAWEPSRDTKIGFTHRRTNSTEREFSTTQLEEDTRTGLERTFLFDLKATTFWGIEHIARAEKKQLDSGFLLSTRGGGREGYSFGAEHSLKLGEYWGVAEKTAIEFEWGWGDESLTYASASSYAKEALDMRMKVERPFGKRLVVTLQGQTDLEQSFYENERDDRDVLDQRLESNFKYDLSDRVGTKLNFLWKKKRTLNIRSAKAVANVDDTNLTVTASYDWDLRPGTVLKQDYQVTAVSAELPFDDTKSNLARTSQLQTYCASQITEKIRVRLEHLFQFRDSGQFGLESDGIRRFGKTTNGIQQWMESELNYQIARSLGLFIVQKFDIRESETISTGRKTRRARTELTWGFNLAHEFGEDFGVSAKFDRVSATDEISYWKGNASLTKVF